MKTNAERNPILLIILPVGVTSTAATKTREFRKNLFIYVTL